MLRRARAEAARKARDRDEEAQRIAHGVYCSALDLKGAGSEIPLALGAPLHAALMSAAPGTLRAAGMKVSDENVADFIRYMVTRIISTLEVFDVAEFRTWCGTVDGGGDEAARAGTQDGERDADPAGRA